MKKHLGDFTISKKTFPNLSSHLKEFRSPKFLKLPERKRADAISRTLLTLIQAHPEPCFLLAPVLDYVSQIEHHKILPHYTFNQFELWLNQASGLTPTENYRIRAKIAGKFIERADYQALFPVGTGKTYDGPHFVTAHKSPDLDTTIASFWGWLDAFAARVGNGLHIWNLPDGPPQSQIEIDWMFRDVFGEGVFSHLPKTRTALNLKAFDLLTQQGMLEKTPTSSIGEIDHQRDHQAVVIVDDEGFYLGDWRGIDFEQVQQVILHLSSCLRWFQNRMHQQLMSLFARESVRFSDVKPMFSKLLGQSLKSAEPLEELTEKQKQQLGRFLTDVLEVKEGLGATFEEVALKLGKMAGVTFDGIDAMKKLFDAKGHLVEKRSEIFRFLERVVSQLHDALLSVRKRLEKLDVALAAKRDVFGHNSVHLTPRSDLDEIQRKIDSYASLTVTAADNDKLYPLGVVAANTLRKNFLGTVSLRDFCNRDEMGIPAYLDVISVIDHHNTTLTTAAPPFAILADVQSCNTLTARQAFVINDRYSLLGQDIKSIEKQLASASAPIAQRLLQRQLAAEHKGSFYIDAEREALEYMHFLYAIFDDTDLLTKVTALDVEIVASLLNRLKTLQTGKETELVSLTNIPRDEKFAKKAAARILQHEETYSLYQKIYAHREKEVERNLGLAAEGKASNLFADTKEQNGCCRIGQTKLFVSNVGSFEKKANALRRVWLEKAQDVYKKNKAVQLHLHMISTIVSADEVYEGKPAKYTHQDELWLWVPSEEPAVEKLKLFLSRFQSSPGLQGQSLELEFLGTNSKELSLICSESFLPIGHKFSKKDLNMAVLKFGPGALNSRKALVAPYLPTE